MHQVHPKVDTWVVVSEAEAKCTKLTKWATSQVRAVTDDSFGRCVLASPVACPFGWEGAAVAVGVIASEESVSLVTLSHPIRRSSGVSWKKT